MERLDILERKEDIMKWIGEDKSKAFICRELSCKPETLNSYLKRMEIDYAGNQGGRGKHSTTYKGAIEYLGTNKFINSHNLKLKLIKDGLKEKKCEICGLFEWQGQPIPLELHHKDHNHSNNSFENLEVICPNCHALQIK